MKKDALYEIKQLQNEIVRITMKNKKDINHKHIGHAQIKIMQYLHSNLDREVYQKDLEAITNSRKSTISGILDTMEKNNMIRRVDSSIDARKKNITLTEDAKKKHTEIEMFFSEVRETITENIADEDLEVFYKVIQKMRENVNKI